MRSDQQEALERNHVQMRGILESRRARLARQILPVIAIVHQTFDTSTQGSIFCGGTSATGTILVSTNGL